MVMTFLEVMNTARVKSVRENAIIAFRDLHDFLLMTFY